MRFLGLVAVMLIAYAVFSLAYAVFSRPPGRFPDAQPTLPMH
jgi:hypothetical protein